MAGGTAKAPKARRGGQVRSWTAYMKLVREFPLRPLENRRDLDAAIAVLNPLLDRWDNLSPDQHAYADVLGEMIHAYEKAHHPVPPLADNELLAYLIESREITQAEVSREAGIAESTVSEILAGKRRIAKSHIPKLAAFLKVDPGYFIAEEAPKSKSRRKKAR